MFVEVAQSLGFRTPHQVSYETIRAGLAALGLILTR